VTDRRPLTASERWLLRWDRLVQLALREDESCGHRPNTVGVWECVRRYRHPRRHIYREVP
jgi:hypothetical protein